jgi:RNA polymerase sigma-70 factor (TIGR02957 family)
MALRKPYRARLEMSGTVNAPGAGEGNDRNDPDGAFEACRPKLFGVAYRMLGSASEAEDVVQDAWLRYAGAVRNGEVRSPEALLTTIVTRLCLDRMKSARATREQYVGPWLPEPLLVDESAGPEQSAALAESVSLAFMVLLETLTPEERAAFLLREIFEYPYDDIAATLGTSPSNCRQLVHRAKARLQDRKPRFREEARDKRALVGRFLAALRDGDPDGLTSVLADDVGLWSDGGGKVSAARRPILGRDQVVQVMIGIRRTARAMGFDLGQVGLQIVDVNGEPALAMRVAGRVDSIYTFEFGDGAITALRVIRNPDKLRFIARQLH